MADFATSAEVGDYLQRTLTAAETTAVNKTLSIVSGSIRRYTRQAIEQGTSTETARVHGKAVLLRELPVVTVTSVTVDGEAFTKYRVADAEAGILLRTDSRAWGTDPVVVTYTHGYAAIPEDIRGVCIDIAVTALENPRKHTQKTTGDVSVSLGSHAGTQVGLQFSETHKEVLQGYRRVLP